MTAAVTADRDYYGTEVTAAVVDSTAMAHYVIDTWPLPVRYVPN